MYDSHIHSKNSHDSKQTLDEICTSAINKGLKGVSVCDHVDMCFSKGLKTYGHMKTCIEEVKAAKEKYKNELKILQGIEMAEYFFDPEEAEQILHLCEYDVILGSSHTVYLEDFDDSYSRLDFSENVPDDKIYRLIKKYLYQLREMAEKTDFDVLAHINCPMRYINGKYKRNLDIMKFKKEITEILEIIISKEIALEMNTSGVSSNSIDGLMPNREIIALYKKMNGKLITLGSDAHVPQNISNGFALTKELLKREGFNCYYYFEKRKPHPVSL